MLTLQILPFWSRLIEWKFFSLFIYLFIFSLLGICRARPLFWSTLPHTAAAVGCEEGRGCNLLLSGDHKPFPYITLRRGIFITDTHTHLHASRLCWEGILKQGKVQSQSDPQLWNQRANIMWEQTLIQSRRLSHKKILHVWLTAGCLNMLLYKRGWSLLRGSGAVPHFISFSISLFRLTQEERACEQQLRRIPNAHGQMESILLNNPGSQITVP